MRNDIVSEYIEILKNSRGYEAFETYLFFNIAPVVKRVKPASLIRITQRSNYLSYWENIKGRIDIKRTEYCEVKAHCGSVVVLFYNRGFLERYLNTKKNREFLNGLGYTHCNSLDDMLERLKERFLLSCPHEIGLFLGYPLEDIEKFIENKGQNCLMCGYWKVYNNKKRAEYIFSCYDDAKKKVLECVNNNNMREIYSITG